MSRVEPNTLRVAIIVASLASKGPVIVARDLAASLVAQGHDVHVYHLDGLRELSFACPTSRLGWSCIAGLKRFDVIHTHSLRPDAVGWGLKHILRHKAVFVSTIHNYVEKDLAFAYGKVVAFIFARLWRWLWRGLDGCAVLSNDALAYYADLRPGVTLRVIYNGRAACDVDTVPDDAASVAAFFRGRYVIGACAAVSRLKGFHQVIEALPAMTDWGFLLIGDGPEVRHLKQLAEHCGVADRVLFLGWKENPVRYFHLLDVYAMASYSEGGPLALLEAASCGKSIICSDVAVFREVFSEQEVCYFQLDDAASLMSAMTKALKHADRFGIAARERFEKDYSVGRMAQHYGLFYRDLWQVRRTQEDH